MRPLPMRALLLACCAHAAAAVTPAVQLSISPAGLVNAGDSIAVTWRFASGVKPRSGDFIGAFASSDLAGAPTVSAVTARQCLSAACRDSRTVDPHGPTQLVFPALVHSRSNYTFLYFSPQRGAAGAWDRPALAASRPVAFADDNEPVGVHLSLTGRAGEAIVSFSTRSGTPAVQFGTAGGPLSRSALGTSSTYAASDLCGAPANDTVSGNFVRVDLLNAVVLTGLPPNQRVSYRAGTLNGSFGKIWTFTMPAVGADAGEEGQVGPGSGRSGYPMRVALFGDLGQDLAYNDRVGAQPGAPATLASILDRDPDLALHIGDVSYARGSGAIWPAFLQQSQAVAATRPYLAGIGNHEVDTLTQAFNWTRGPDSGGECGVPYSAHYTNPGQTPGALRRDHWWSVDIGAVHFVTLSSEADWTAGSKQHGWLAADLAAVNRTRTPWVVLSTHRPFYTSGNGWLTAPFSVGYTAAQRAALEPLMRMHQVDLAVVGHVHKYERTCRMAGDGRCADAGEPGTVHLVLGAAGEPFQTGCNDCSAWEHVAVTEGSAAQQRSGGAARQFAAPEWSAFRSLEFGYGLLTVENSTSLFFEYVGAKDGVVHDSVRIHRNPAAL